MAAFKLGVYLLETVGSSKAPPNSHFFHLAYSFSSSMRVASARAKTEIKSVA